VYPKEFRDDVARFARNRKPGVSVEKIASEFGIHFTTLYKWMRKTEAGDGKHGGHHGCGVG
jgi:transposase-like protein